MLDQFRLIPGNGRELRLIPLPEHRLSLRGRIEVGVVAGAQRILARLRLIELARMRRPQLLEVFAQRGDRRRVLRREQLVVTGGRRNGLVALAGESRDSRLKRMLGRGALGGDPLQLRALLGAQCVQLGLSISAQVSDHGLMLLIESGELVSMQFGALREPALELLVLGGKLLRMFGAQRLEQLGVLGAQRLDRVRMGGFERRRGRVAFCAQGGDLLRVTGA